MWGSPLAVKPAQYIPLRFIWVSNLTLLNMLLGILVEVIAKMTEAQELESTVAFMRSTLLEKLKEYDADRNGGISHDEFQMLIEDKEVFVALTEMDVDVEYFKSLSEYLFEDPESGEPTRRVSFSELMEATLHMQASKTARVLDVVDCQKCIRGLMRNFMEEFREEVQMIKGNMSAVAKVVGADVTMQAERRTNARKSTCFFESHRSRHSVN